MSACQQCNDSILNPSIPSLCVDCQEGCATQLNLDCAVYHPDNDVPSTLYNLGLGNNISATAIFEKIDFLIGQNFNIDLTVVNSNSILLTASGPAKHVLTANLKVSPDIGNKLEIRANGVYVA